MGIIGSHEYSGEQSKPLGGHLVGLKNGPCKLSQSLCEMDWLSSPDDSILQGEQKDILDFPVGFDFSPDFQHGSPKALAID